MCVVLLPKKIPEKTIGLIIWYKLISIRRRLRDHDRRVP